MQELRVAYVNVFVSDLDRALDFYGKLLCLPLRHSDPEHGYASFDAGPVDLGVAVVAPGSEQAARHLGRHTGVGFAVGDLERAYEQLVAKGVKFTMPPQRQPWGGQLATFVDPDGNQFYLDPLTKG